MTSNKGIDYGLGMTNIDKKSGIRFGVIPAHEVLEAWAGKSEPYYGEPTCPKCGLEVMEAYYDERTCRSHDYFCKSCQEGLDSEEVFGDEPNSWFVDDGDYRAEQSRDDGDVFIVKSPYYTRSQFCSPCAPGAGYLLNPCPDGEKTYCFGHDWYESVPTGRIVDCEYCRGTGLRRKEEVGEKFIRYGGAEIVDDDHVKCWVCREHSGKVAEYIQKAPYLVYRVSDDTLVEPEIFQGPVIVQ